MNEVTRMVLEAGFVQEDDDIFVCGIEHIEKLLQIARNQTWTTEHWTAYEEGIVAAEREACARVCEEMQRNGAWVTKEEAAAAIRRREET